MAANKKPKMVFGWLVIFIIFLVTIGVYALKLASRNLILDSFEGKISGATVDFGSGGGSQIEVLGSQDIKYHGKQAIRLKYKAISDGYMWLARGYNLDIKGAAQWLIKPQDINWPKYYALSFYMYGSNSGASVAFDIIDSGYEYFRFMVKDDFMGWKQIVCPFEQFFPRGDWQPEKAEKNARLDFPVNAFQFEPRTLGEGILYFDYMHLIRKK